MLAVAAMVAVNVVFIADASDTVWLRLLDDEFVPGFDNKDVLLAVLVVGGRGIPVEAAVVGGRAIFDGAFKPDFGTPTSFVLFDAVDIFFFTKRFPFENLFVLSS